MLRPPVTVPIAIVQGTLSGLAARDVATDPWLAEVGIAPELLEEAGHSHVTAQQYTALFRLLIDRLDDEAVAFLSRPLRRGSFALVLRSTLGAPSLEAALRRLIRSFWLLQDDVVLVRVREGPLAGLALHLTEAAASRSQNFLHELLLRVSWLLTAWLHGGHLAPRGFDFAFEEPSYAADYARIFPGTLRFGQGRSAFWFDAAALAAPMRRDEHALKTFLAAAPGNVIVPRLAEQAVGDRVRALLQHARPAWPDLATAARSLHVSASTLQRRLAAEGTSFRTVKDELRRDLAIVRLNTSAAPLAALSEELGFADSAAFQRAFKAWTGRAPGSFRRRPSPPVEPRLTAFAR